MRSFIRAICVWVARISCKTAVIEPSSRSTIEVSTAASSRRLSISLMIRSLWRATKLISASVIPMRITRQNIAYNGVASALSVREWRDRNTTSRRDYGGAVQEDDAERLRRASGVHRLEEVGVALGIAQLVEQEIDGIHGTHGIEDAAQDVHLLELIRRDQELLLARAGTGDVHRRESPLVRDLAVENDFRIAGALELLEDHLVHAAAGIDQGGGDDGERAALLDVARRAEEPLGPLQRVSVHAAGQHLARRGHHGVVGAPQPRDRIQQDDDVAAVLDETLGLLDDHLCDLNVPRCRLVEGGGYHFAFDRALHVGDFLGPLIDEQNNQVALRVVGRDRVRDILQQHGLACARRRYDQRTLPLADRGDNVDDAGREILLARILMLHAQPLLRIERREVVEVDLVARLVRILEIDRVDFEERKITLAVLGRADVAVDGVAGTQAKPADLRGGDVDVVGTRQVVRLRRAQKTEAVGQHLNHAFANDVGFAHGELLEDTEHQLLLTHGAGIFHRELLGERYELARRLGLEVLKFHFPHAG